MILVTGGTGSLGRALVDRLLQNGDEVRVLSRKNKLRQAEAFLDDITAPKGLDAAMRDVQVVYHLAALVDHYASPETLHRVNVQGTVNVIEAAIRNGVERFIHCSSVSAEPGGGTTDYGKSKIETERQLKTYRDDIPVIIIRPGPVYHEDRRNFRRFLTFCKRTGITPVLAPDVMVHLASRKNVIDAFFHARNHGTPGNAYAVCDREPIHRSTLSRIIAQETGGRLITLPLPVLLPFLHIGALLFEGMHHTFGYRPLFNRHYLKVLTRERAYDVTRTRKDLGFESACTEKDFRESVQRCLGAR